MKNQNKNIQTISRNIGLLLMTAAATVGMVEVPEQHSSRVVTNSQPVFAFASQTIGGEDVNPLRREKEEHGAHYSTYSTTQRTAARAGRI